MDKSLDFQNLITSITNIDKASTIQAKRAVNINGTGLLEHIFMSMNLKGLIE